MALDELNLSLAAVRIPCAAAVKDGASEFEAGLTGDGRWWDGSRVGRK